MATHISTRYFIILVKNKQEAKETLKIINSFLNENLKLQLNKKSKYYPNTHGIDFCGYKIFETHVLLRKRFKNKIKKNLKLWNFLAKQNKLDYKKMMLSLNSFLAHAGHANSYNFIKKLGI